MRGMTSSTDDGHAVDEMSMRTGQEKKGQGRSTYVLPGPLLAVSLKVVPLKWRCKRGPYLSSGTIPKHIHPLVIQHLVGARIHTLPCPIAPFLQLLRVTFCQCQARVLQPFGHERCKPEMLSYIVLMQPFSPSFCSD